MKKKTLKKVFVWHFSTPEHIARLIESIHVIMGKGHKVCITVEEAE